MSKKPQTIAQFFKQFPDDESCLNHLFEIRFGQGFECPSCERPSKWFRIKAERAYSCQLGVTYKTAWRMAHLIREHMADVDGEAPIGGPGTAVEVDETLIGGVKKGKHMRGSAGKHVVLGMMERDGDIIAKVVPNQRKHTLQPIIEAHVEKGGQVHTDELNSYNGLHTKGYRHMTVRILEPAKAHYQRNAYSRIGQAYAQIREGSRVSLQSSGLPGDDAFGTAFDFRAIA